MGNKGAKAGSMTTSSSSSTYVRSAYHAGSWYQDDSRALGKTLEKFLSQADLPTSTVEALCPPSITATTTTEEPNVGGAWKTLFLRAIICPHAGYSYSGPTAAYSYRALRHELASSSSSSSSSSLPRISTIVVLHPSHHVYLNGCAVSGAHELETPVGNLVVDSVLRDEILQLPGGAKFSVMSKDDDDHEHSGEMQYPYIAQILQSLQMLDQVQVLPIMCGSLSTSQEISYGRVLASILDRPEILTVISTDFCHWGTRFQYNPTPAASLSFGNNSQEVVPIHEFIAQLDRRGMDLIAAQTPGAFAEYLKETRNTICGRHAVAVWLRAVESCSTNHAAPTATAAPTTSTPSTFSALEISFVKYAQSMAATSLRDSSVSYAAALATKKQTAI
ncbi:hypothetical protein ACA910_020594 [Epithemia clementina (nom. ined.)]